MGETRNLIVLHHRHEKYGVNGLVRFLIQVFHKEYYRNILSEQYNLNVLTTADIQKELKMSNEEFVAHINKTDAFEKSIVFGIHPAGYTEIIKILKIKNIVTVGWQDDLHAFYKYLKITNPSVKITEYSEKYTSPILDGLDYIVTPSYLYFKNLNMSEYEKKSVDIFYFLNPDWFDSLLKRSYKNKKNQIILSGSLAAGYKSRLLMQRLTNTSQDFKELMFILKHPGYKDNDHMTEMNYYNKLSEFKAAFVGHHNFPINFCLAKHIEVLMCGCLGFFEPNPLLESQLGLKEYTHYIPCYRDGNLIDDSNFYTEWIKNGEEIARNGQKFVMENFGEKQIHKLFQFLASIK
jgi:hypothetical protein